MQKQFFSFLLLIFMSIASFSQTAIENDYWFTAGLSKKLNKRVKVYVEPELRFSNTFELNELIIEAGTDFKVNKYLGLSAAYRYTDEYKKLGTYHYNQIGFDVKPSYELFNLIDLGARIRYSNFSDYGIEFENSFAMRYKIGAEYKLKPIKTSFDINAEWFELPDFTAFKKVRYSFGAEYDIHKIVAFGFSYKYEHFLLKEKNEGIFNFGVKVKL